MDGDRSEILKKWLTWLWGSARQAGSLEGTESIILSPKPENSGRISVLRSAGRPPSSLGDPTLCLLSPSADWMRPSHSTARHLLYSKSTNLNANPIFKNTFTATPRPAFDHISGHVDAWNSPSENESLSYKPSSVSVSQRGQRPVLGHISGEVIGRHS